MNKKVQAGKKQKATHLIIFTPILLYPKCLLMQGKGCVFVAKGRWAPSGDNTFGFYITLAVTNGSLSFYAHK